MSSDAQMALLASDAVRPECQVVLGCAPLLGSAHRAAGQVRGPRSGRLSLDSVAAELGVAVRLSDLGTTLWGVTLSDRDVAVNSRLPRLERRFSLAHEVAHVLVRRQPGAAVGGWREERYADAFARELLLPRAAVRLAAAEQLRTRPSPMPDQCGASPGWDGQDRSLLVDGALVGALASSVAARLQDEYDVDEGTVLLQAAAEGLRPSVQAMGGGRVLCVDCGHRAQVPGCLCRPLRRAARKRSCPDADGGTVVAHPGWRTTCW